MSTEHLPALRPSRVVWNEGRIVGQKRPLQPKHVWSIRVRLEMADNARDLALFDRALVARLDPLGDPARPRSLRVHRRADEQRRLRRL